jgi:arginase
MGREIEIIGVPADFGGNRRGVDMGPSALRYAGMTDHLTSLGHHPLDNGDIDIPPRKRSYEGESDAKCLEEIAAFTRTLSGSVRRSLENDRFPLVLGGDHSIAIGSMKGSAADADIGMVWFDAHGDINTPQTSPSGNVHGMPVAAALRHGRFEDTSWANAPGLQEENIVLLGLRDLDPGEQQRIRESNVTAFTMRDIDELGIEEVIHQAIEIANKGTDGIHASLDMDWLDPQEAPGVGTPVYGGVTYREAHLAFEILAEHDQEEGILRSMDVAEVNPILDQHNQTAELACELVASAFGKEIL